MQGETNGVSGANGDAGGTTDGGGRHDEHLTQAQRQRDAAKERARKAEAEAAAARAELDALRSTEEERQAEIARKAGEFGKVEERYKREAEAKDKRIAEYERREHAQIRGERRSAFAEAVRAKTGIADVAIVRGILRDAADDGTLDDAPEEVTEDAVAEAARQVQIKAPTLFTTRSTPRVAAGSAASDIQIPDKYANDPIKREAYLLGVARSTPRR